MAVEDLAAPVLRTFCRIGGRCRLTQEEASVLPGRPEAAALQRWQEDLTQDAPARVLFRISYVLGNYNALQVKFPHAQQADTWLRCPNQAPLFGGRPALAILLEGGIDGLAQVRGYLDATLV